MSRKFALAYRVPLASVSVGLVIGLSAGAVNLGFSLGALAFALAIGVPFACMVALILRALVFVQVGPQGLRAQNIFGQYRTVPWASIARVHPTRFLGVRYLRVYSHDFRFPIWVPLQLGEPEQFRASIHESAPSGSPVLKHVDAPAA